MTDSPPAANPDASGFVAQLAGRPLLVVGTTLGVSVVITAVLLVAAHGMDATGVVTTLATLWALVLALVIYLLTARDTDRLLGRIDALQDQLSAVLEAPGPGAEVVGDQPAAPIMEPDAAAAPAPATAPEPASDLWSRLAERVPTEYLDELRRQAGVDAERIRRAWTPSPDGRGPWVVEGKDGGRWSVFGAGHGRPSVVPLSSATKLRQERADRRERQRQEHAELRRAKHDHSASEGGAPDR